MTRLPVFVALSMLAFGCGKAVPTSEGGRATTPAPGRNAQRDESGGRATTFPPDDWTHKDLAEYLKGKGIEVTVRIAPLLDKPDRPASYFTPKVRGAEEEAAVYRCANADAANATASALGMGAFSFGRFAIGCHVQNDDNLAFVSQLQMALR